MSTLSNCGSFHDILLEKLKQNNITNLQDVKFSRILKNSCDFKRISIEFTYSDVPGILILEKSFFENDLCEKFIENLLNDSILRPSEILFRNDSYGAYYMKIIDSSFIKDWNQVFVNIIHPARPKDIEKTLDVDYFLVRETPELYNKITKPYINSQVQSGNLLWVYNFLEKKAEVDRIIYEKDITSDNGYIVGRDMKWKCNKPIEEMTETEKQEIHLTAFVTRRDLRSLRDLRLEHLPLLKSIQNDARRIIGKKLGIDPDALRLYIHYQPSFYHLHVHFTHLKSEVGGYQTERAHLLSQVIANIELIPDYYERITMNFSISKSSSLKREQYQ